MRFKKWTLALGVLLAAGLVGGCAMILPSMLEQPYYTVIARLGDAVEIRDYAPRTYAESSVPADGPEPRRDAFRLLFNYIAGANAGENKIDMTIPVATERPGAKIDMTAPVSTSNEGSDYRMRFFLPSKFTEENAPAPTNPAVRIGTVPARIEAAIRYTGSQSEEKNIVMRARLLDALAESTWKPTGTPSAMFYNPPFSVPFLRRNEAIVAVEKK